MHVSDYQTNAGESSTRKKILILFCSVAFFFLYIWVQLLDSWRRVWGWSCVDLNHCTVVPWDLFLPNLRLSFWFLPWLSEHKQGGLHERLRQEVGIWGHVLQWDGMHKAGRARKGLAVSEGRERGEGAVCLGCWALMMSTVLLLLCSAPVAAAAGHSFKVCPTLVWILWMCVYTSRSGACGRRWSSPYLSLFDPCIMESPAPSQAHPAPKHNEVLSVLQLASC